MQKNSYLLSRERATAKMFISLKIQQNVHFTQCLSSKVLISGLNRLKCGFHVNA